MEDGVAELGGLLEEQGRFARVGGAEAFHLADNVDELGGRELLESAADGVWCGQTIRERGALRKWWKRVASSIRLTASRRPVHVELLSAALVLVVVIIPLSCSPAVVVAVVNPQGSTHYVVLIEVAHRRRRFVGVGVFEKSEALGSTSLLIIYKAKVYDASGAAEQLAYLLLADSCMLLDAH